MIPATETSTDPDFLAPTCRPLPPLFDIDLDGVLSQAVDDSHLLRLPQTIEDIIYSNSPLIRSDPNTVVHPAVQTVHSKAAASVESPLSDFTSEATAVIPTAPPKRKNSFSCSYEKCGRVFSKKWNLQAHLRLHTGEKPFACRLGCGEKHMWMSSLKSHENRKCKLLPPSARIRKKIRPRHFVPRPVSVSPCASFSSAVSEYHSSEFVPVNPICYRSADQPSKKKTLVQEGPVELWNRNSEIVRELECILSSRFI